VTTVVIAAGGTAGHVVPAIAIADALRAEGASVVFAGGERAEAELVPAAGYPFEPIRVEGLSRTNPLKAARAAFRAVGAVRAARRILDRHGADVVLGGGGYVAGPMVLAARLRGIPAVLTEADAHLGLANRLAAPFAKRVFLALPVAGRDGAKYVAVGRPVPSRSVAAPRAEARARLGLPGDGPVVLVFGGSLGARVLNEIALDAWADSGPAVLHLCGERDYPMLRDRATRADYVLRPFLDEVGLAYGAADLAVARAGGSVWELAAAGLPAVLVPGDFATGGHQRKNAEWFVHAGGAVLVPEADADRIPQVVADLLADPAKLSEMSSAMRAAARPDAAERIADELVELAAARR
jgi:UDP-N-acetylglucosamine--N-acetylmuramyl-(pentapeptide) pyrophosphoryl-undecaprenol N-acetylglucosamine transferase